MNVLVDTNRNGSQYTSITLLQTQCHTKFDCLIKEMLFIRKLQPTLNVQTDSIIAIKVFFCSYAKFSSLNQYILHHA